jgi:hypothetical protein
MRNQAEQERASLERELTALYSCMDAAYKDKHDGKITEDFWQRNQAVWQTEVIARNGGSIRAFVGGQQAASRKDVRVLPAAGRVQLCHLAAAKISSVRKLRLRSLT